ncbi:hypothetical protein WA026_015345 [Henosepilachna vigintioctopunctata]|uniref:HTH CENPB-type domain-containing protein n=1 Tax=Henosepilachna vigintioctopunctata TaxID=420089 RepID=A0AAW1UC89_9CUCU
MVDDLLKWFKHQRENNFPISGPILQQKAYNFSRLMSNENSECSSFHVQRFCARQSCGKMKGALSLIGLCLIDAIRINEAKNPTLPAYEGQVNTTSSKHTFLYHINLTTPGLSLIHIKTSSVKLNNSLDFKNDNNYFILLKNKIANSYYPLPIPH